MKTYILNNLDKITNYGKALDIKSLLYNKNWEILNDSKEKEVLIFREKGELLIAKNGVITNSHWDILPTGSFVINTDSQTFLFNAAFVDTNIFVLQLDGTKDCIIMVDSNADTKLMLDSIKQIEEYLQDKYATKEELEKIVDRVSNTISPWKVEFRFIKGFCLFVYSFLFWAVAFFFDEKYKYTFEQQKIGDNIYFISLPLVYLLFSFLWNNKYINYKIEKYKIKYPKDPLNPYLKANWRI